MAKRGKPAPANPFVIIAGRNSVRAALVAGTRRVETIVIDRGALGPVVEDIRDLARRAGVRQNVAEARELDRLVGGDFHQGVAAYVEKGPRPNWGVVEQAVGEGSPVVVLDHVEDPRNLGAILRGAAAFGVGAVIIPERRQSPLTAAVSKTAEGGLEAVPVVTVSNVHQTVRRLKDAGVWCYGCEAEGTAVLGEFEFTIPAAFVLGGEDTGLGKAVRQACDAVVSIPLAGVVTSLNVAAAAAVTLYEFRRQHPLP